MAVPDYTLQFSVVWSNWDLLLEGAAYTLALTAASGVTGLVAGIVCAEVRRNGGKIARGLVAAYVEFIRNTPFIVQMFFIFFGLPSAGIKIDAGQAAFLAMSVNIGAYFTEIIRAGLDASPAGQYEASTALGLRRRIAFLLVILPPSIARVYPALVSQFVLVFLGSAVVSQIAAEDLTFQAQYLQSRTFRAFELYFTITLVYFAMTLGWRFFFSWARGRIFPWQPKR